MIKKITISMLLTATALISFSAFLKLDEEIIKDNNLNRLYSLNTNTDSEWNSIKSSHSILVNDVADAIANAQCKDITVYLDLTGNATIGFEDINDGSTESGDITYSISPNSFDCSNIGDNTVTLTVTYDVGSDSCEATVTVVDNTAPTPDVATLPDVTAQCEVTTLTPPTATDNCSGTINGTTTDPLTYNTQGTYTINWTYDDGNGNTSTQAQTVIVDDTIAPVPDVAALPNVTGECSATVTAPTAIDTCSGTITGTTTDPLTYNTQGTFTINWTYDDGNGNTSTQSQTVIVDDTSAPVPDVAILPNVTGECSATVTAPTATDNCSGTITATTTDPLTYNTQGAYTINWTYDDGNGNTSTQPQTVIVDDTSAPVPDVATLPDVTDECDASVTAPTATDTCSGTIIGTTTDPLTYNTQGSYTINWIYDDGNGNTSTQTQTVIVDDTSAPVPDVAALPNVTGECSATVTAPTATDTCSGTITATTTDPLTYNTQGTYTIHWTYDDGNGNTSTQSQTVIVDDTSAPVPDVAALPNVTGECSATVTAPTATDNCSGTINGTTTDPLTYNTQGTYTINWTYDDGNGNTSTQAQTVIVDDTIAPVPDVATLPDVTGECDASVTAPTAIDTCSGTITGTTTDPLTYNTQGTFTINWTYDDGNGNTSTQPQTVIVDDTIAPVPDVATLPSVTGECSVTVTAPTATDNCSGTITATTTAPLTYSTQGTHVITWTYDDGNGNTSTQPQTVIVDDTIAPVPDVATLPSVTSECSVTVTAPTATDTCSGTITATTTDPLTYNTQGTYTIHWTYDDGNGNTSTQPQTVIVDDTSVPVPDVATLPDVTGECDATVTAPTATDTCSGTITATTTDPLTYNTQGTYTINWTYDDGNGNTSTQPQTVIVDDTSVPVPDVATLPDVTGECDATVTAPTATDNCSGTITATTTDPLTYNAQGTYTIHWTYDDGNGNISTQTQNIIIDDKTPPVVPTLADVIVGECSGTPTAPNTTDNCSGTIIGTTTTVFPITTQGTTIVTWTFDDENGNIITANQNVIVTDTTPPTFNFCPISRSINNDLGNCGAIVTYTIPTANDNCGTVTINQTDATGLTSGDNFPIGTTTIEYTATDGNGNNSICTFTITVIDNEMPTIECPLDDIVVEADSNCEFTSEALALLDPSVITTPSFGDNCTGVNISNNLAGQLPLPVGNHIITWTVSDEAGNTINCNQNITVADVTPPVITCPTPSPFYNTDAGQCHATLSFNATATDNCNGSPIITYEVAGTPITFPYAFTVGTTTVDVIADDGNGLISTCSFNVIVQDNEAPIAVCQTFTVPLDASGNASIVASDIDGGSFDNCSTVTLNASQTTFTCANVGTNNVTLTVTDAAGNIATCNAVVTVLDHVQGATATITSTSGSPICLGESVTFTATGTNLGANPSYQWFEGGTPVGTNSDTYTTTGLTNGENVYVEITSGPCNTVTISNSIVMTVNPLLPVTFTLNASANPACSGENVTFFVTGLTNGGATPTYQWYVNGTPVGGNTNSYNSTTINDNDVVSVDVSSSLACANPIPATESMTMTVNPLPTVTAQANGSSTNITICEGGNLTLTGSGATTYTWDNGVTNGVTFVPTVGTHTYTVTGTSNGCSSTDTIEVTVTPNATITHISGDTNQHVCENNGGDNVTQLIVNTITYSISNATIATVTGLPPGVTYNFNSGTGILTINGNPNDVATTTTYNYTISTNGCGTATASGSITVYNNPDLETPYGVSGWFGSRDIRGEGYVCLPTVETYYVHNNNDVQYYEWQVPAGCTIIGGAGTNEITVQFSNAYNGNGSIRVRAVNPCDTSSWRSKRVRINPIQSLELNAGNDVIACNDETIHLEGSIVDANLLINSVWLNWDDNGAAGNFINITNNGLNIEYVHPPVTEITTVNISLTAYFVSLLCSEGVTDNMTITIYPDPTATITTSSPVCEGEDVVVSGTPNTTVSYNYNGNPAGTFNIGASGTVTFTGLGAGTYSLTSIEYTNAPNCPETINSSVTINEPPTVTAPADVTICEGDTVDLSAATIGGTNYVGTWTTSGNGTFAGNIYTPHAADVFNSPITLTYTNTPSDGICSPVSDSMLVTINQAPTIYAGVDQTICNSDTVTMTASFGGSATSGTWSGGTGTFSSNLPNATYTPGIGETGTVILTYTSNDPAGPCNSAIDTVEITIDQGATVDAGTDQTICEGDTVTLTASFGGSATSATWNTSGSGTFAGNIYTPSVADINNGSVLLTYTTNNPTGVCNPVSDSMLVTINPQPTVNVGNNQTVCSTSTSITMNAVLGGGASSATWSTSGDGSFNNNNTNAVYTFGTNDIANGSVTLTYTTNDPTGPCIAATDSFVVNIIPYIAANPSYTYATNNGDCSDTILNLSADGTGYWSAVSVPAGSPFTFSDTTNPNATFTGESGTEYNLTWNVDNAAPCGDNDATISVTFPTCEDNLNFDGIDDSVNLADNYNLSAPFSIEIWIKPNEIKSGIQTILSKRDASNFATGYDLRLVNNNIIFRANGSGLFTGGITADRWYHIAITYGSNIYTLYVDGVQKNSIAVTFNPSPNNFNMLLGAMARPNNTPTNFFHGWIDELRIWNTVLSRDQIRLMMNQEIENDGGNVIGSVTGNQVSTGLNWSDLTAYYQMNQSSPSPDIIAGQLIATKGVTGTLRNMTTRQPESAPLPYLSSGSNTNWDQQNTWLHGTEQMIPNTNGINWNIVQIEDDVNISRETNVLGLVIQANKLTVNNNQPLYVNKYLKINGVLDLEGESQLLQPVGSIVDYSGTGKLERDQQGTSNMFNYNYWGSPVSTSGSALDRNYTVGAILYDGSNPVNWVTSHNTAITSNPVTISSRWLYTYANLTGLYSEWQSINQGTPIDVGLGYTMKGSGAATPNQNYTFVGQPNNGDIKVSITANNESLMGNPYPSAIDAHTFIDDNETVLLAGSALIFWEQAPNNPNHILADYLGRYSYLSKAGGLQAASSPTEINGVGNATKIPGRYIPVGQGFFVKAENDGDVVFNNGQREFMKEGAQSVFLRPEGDVTTQSETNTNDVDLIKRIRFGFKTPEGAFRHLLLAFTPDNDATDAVDYGYDALNSDDFPSDMSFLIEDDNYVIQGVGEFDITKVYPLEMVLGQQGNVEVELGELENFDEEIDVFIYDAVLNTYTRFNDVNFQMNLEAGTYSNRFYLTFQEDAELSIIEDEFETVIVRYLHDTDEIYVKTPPSIQVKQLYLINVAGQMVYSWNATNLPMSHEIKIPVKHISEGAYILKAETDTGTFNRKLIIKYKR